MSERLSLTQIVVLCGYAAAMAGGQILFKTAALRFTDGTLVERVIGLFQNWVFLLAMALYLLMAVAWVWILSFTPLSRAYPFVTLAFVLTPLLGSILFAEPLTWRLVLGLVVIFGGLILVSG